MSGGETTVVEVGTAFEPYLPRLTRNWAAAPGQAWQAVDGTLVSLDISGFTSLSERLAEKGRLGAEELILILGACFDGLIGIAERYQGDVLKFRGDALLILYDGPGHESRACLASAEMQRFVEEAAPSESSVGEVALRMSTGIFSGVCHFFLIGSTHRELLVTGPAATATVELESAAEAGEILVSAATAGAVEPRWLAGEREDARLLNLSELEPIAVDPSSPAEAPVAEELLEAFLPAPLRAHLALEAGEGEHRQVTAAFLKYTEVDALLEREGPEALLAKLQPLGEIVGDAAAELGVTWLESDVDGDGGKLYLTAGAPSSAGGDEERMLRTMRQVLDAGLELPLKSGITRGHVFAGDIGTATRRTYAVMGDVVNLAARLTARAERGQIFATAEVLDRSRGTFETTHQPFLVKGKERPVTAYSVGALIGTREEEVSTDLPLAGRETELEMLQAAINAARLRQSQLVELVGEPGIGKSRLVEELKTLAVGFQQLVARCESYESSHPFFALRPLLRSLVGITPEQGAEEAGQLLTAFVQGVMPDLVPWLPLLAIPFEAEVASTPDVDALDPAFRRDRLHEVVEQFMQRVLLMPTLLVFEDAHWMDDSSDFLLRHLTAAPSPRPWLVCATRRPEGAPFVNDGNGTAVVLEPLPAEATTALALAAAEEHALSNEDLTALTERSGGNPLFVRELIAAARSGQSLDVLPETVETLMTTRMDTLEPADRILLRSAAVVGPSFDLDLLGEVLADQPIASDDPESWERLAEFVSWSGSRELRFRHDLFRAMAYEGLSFRRRRELHGRVGEALERRAGDGLDDAAGLLSLHFAEAQEHEKAWRYSVLAGERAQAKFANVVAGELYERALAAAAELPHLRPQEIACVAESLGDVAELFARYDKASAAYARARELVGDDGVAKTRLLRKEGVLKERSGEYAEALSWYEQGLSEVQAHSLEASAPENLIELELAYAGVRFRQGSYEDAFEWAERAAGHAEAAGDRPALAHAYYLLDGACSQLGRPDGPAYLERALPIFEECGDELGKASVLNNLGINAYFKGDWEQALDYYAHAREAKQRAGDVVRAALQASNEAEIVSDQGDLDRAEALFSDSLQVFRAAGYAFGIALAQANLGRAAARGGRFEDAERLLEQAQSLFAEIGSAAFLLEAKARLAECLVFQGEHGRARALAQETLEEAQEEGSAVFLAFLRRVLGYAELQGGNKEEAARHFEESLEAARSVGAQYELALTLQASAELARRGGPGDPEALAAESKKILDGLGVVTTPRIPLP